MSERTEMPDTMDGGISELVKEGKSVTRRCSWKEFMLVSAIGRLQPPMSIPPVLNFYRSRPTLFYMWRTAFVKTDTLVKRSEVRLGNGG